MKESKPSCFDCIHSEFIKGHMYTMYDPGEPDTAECKHPHFNNWTDEVDEMFGNHTENELPEKCGKFQPKLIERCGCQACKKEMNVPEYSWKHFAHDRWSGEPIAVCGEDCKAAIEVMQRFEEVEEHEFLKSEFS
jgi:hypothetical protein